jgi:hypothetical protein
MTFVVNNEADRTLLRTSRTGLGLLNAMFAEMYCAELANRSELLNKLSLTSTAVLSTAAAATLLQTTVPAAAPYFAVGSAVVSALGSVFAWRSRTLALVKASRSFGDQVVEWTELWESLRTTQTIDATRVAALEHRNNEITESIAPVRMKTRLSRRLQQRIRSKVGLV